MTGFRAWAVGLPLLMTAMAVVSVGCDGGSSRVSLDGATRVTARNVNIGDGIAFTLSPNGRFLVYASTSDGKRTTGLSRLDLVSGAIDEVPLDPRYHSVYPKAAAWVGERFYQRLYFENRSQLVYWDAASSQLEQMRAREGSPPGSCADCESAPRVEDLREPLGVKYLSPELRAQASRDPSASVRTVYYSASLGGDLRCGVLRWQNGRSDLVVEHKSLRLSLVINYMRVSPDGRWLAYVLASRPRSLIPLPGRRHTVWLLDLKSGEGSWRLRAGSIASLMWAPDSSSLYVAGHDATDATLRGMIWRIDIRSQ